MSAIFNVLKYIPATAGVKLLEKFNPKFKNYFSQVAAYGLDTNRALDYLSHRFRDNQSYDQHLQQQETKGTARPDELASKTSVENQKIPGKIARSLASLGGGLIGGSASFGSDLVSNPQQQMPESSPSQDLDPLQILSQYSPDLPQMLQKYMQHGLSPREAAMSISTNFSGPLRSVIAQIQQDHGLNFVDFIDQLFSSGQQSSSTASSIRQGMPARNAGAPDKNQALIAALQDLYNRL